MYSKHQTLGIVLETKIEGDSNLRVGILTKEFGFVWAKAQGARKVNSKFKAGCQIFSLTHFSLVSGKAGWKIVGAIYQKNFYEILKSEKEKIFIIANVSNLLKKLLNGEEKNESLFGVVFNFFIFLEEKNNENIALAECLVLLRILYLLGYMRHDPEFSIPISDTEIKGEYLEKIATKRFKITKLINEALKAT